MSGGGGGKGRGGMCGACEGHGGSTIGGGDGGRGRRGMCGACGGLVSCGGGLFGVEGGVAWAMSGWKAAGAKGLK